MKELQQLWFKAIDAIQHFEHTNFTRNQPTDDDKIEGELINIQKYKRHFFEAYR